MKIWKWIDSYFASSASRKAFLVILVCFYWIWQLVWQEAVMVRILQLTGYDSVFALQSELKGYTSSFLIRFTLEVISSGALSLSAVLHAALAVSFSDLVFWLMTILVCAACWKSRKVKWILAAAAAMLVVLLLYIYLGFAAVSLNMVVSYLQQMAWIETILHLFCLLILLWVLLEIVPVFLMKNTAKE